MIARLEFDTGTVYYTIDEVYPAAKAFSASRPNPLYSAKDFKTDFDFFLPTYFPNPDNNQLYAEFGSIKALTDVVEGWIITLLRMAKIEAKLKADA